MSPFQQTYYVVVMVIPDFPKPVRYFRTMTKDSKWSQKMTRSCLMNNREIAVSVFKELKEEEQTENRQFAIWEYSLSKTRAVTNPSEL